MRVDSADIGMNNAAQIAAAERQVREAAARCHDLARPYVVSTTANLHGGCSTCHKPHLFKATPTECITCHQKRYDEAIRSLRIASEERPTSSAVAVCCAAPVAGSDPTSRCSLWGFSSG